MLHVVYAWLLAGTPAHYCYVIALAMLLAEDLIARSPLKANSTVQLVFQLLGYIPGVGPVLAKLGPKVVILALVGLSVSGCPAAKGVAIDIAACAVGQVPSVVAGIIPDVQQALEGVGVDWASSLEGIGVKAGADALACAIKSIIAQYQHSELPAPKLWGLARGQAWLEAHGYEHR